MTKFWKFQFIIIATINVKQAILFLMLGDKDDTDQISMKNFTRVL